MIVFASMIAKIAEKAGIKVPEDPESWEKEDVAKEHPHFKVFCLVQLCRPIQWGEEWDNAKVVASIPENEIRTITLEGLLERGLRINT